MKKKLAVCLLVLSLIFGSVNAMAAVGVKGANKDDAENVQSVELNNGAVKVQYKGEKDTQYMVMAVPVGMGEPSKASIKNNEDKQVVYMNQATANGEGVVEFDIHPLVAQDDQGNYNKGEYSIYISSTNSELTKVGTFTIDDLIDLIKGDLDGVEGRSIDDIMVLIKYVADKYSVEEATAAADLDNDGFVTIDDIMLLIKMVANKE